MNDEIVVYDDYKISLYKYPRVDTDKEKTDIIIIIFLMHEEFLKKLGQSFEDALKYYHECKEYYYIFNFNKEIKKYSAKEIIHLINNTNEFFRNNTNIIVQQNYLKKLNKLDASFYFYIKNKDFYTNLYKSLEHAKKSYFERREYSYRVSPPIDFYNRISNQTYSAIEFMEINSYAQYLKQRKIIQDLPIPIYIK